MVLVFKTSVTQEIEVAALASDLHVLTLGNGRWNFDLEDCDHILRVESTSLYPWEVISLLEKRNFWCRELEDVVMVNDPSYVSST